MRGLRSHFCLQPNRNVRFDESPTHVDSFRQCLVQSLLIRAVVQGLVQSLLEFTVVLVHSFPGLVNSRAIRVSIDETPRVVFYRADEN